MEELAPDPSPILPFLFLGNERDANAKSLEKLKIKYVLDITSQLSETFEKSGVRYKRLSAADSYHQNLIQYFEEAFEFIGKSSLYLTVDRNSFYAGVKVSHQ